MVDLPAGIDTIAELVAWLKRRGPEYAEAFQRSEVIRAAVKGMLPRNRLARQQLTKLKVYAGPEHPHEAQNPQPLPES